MTNPIDLDQRGGKTANLPFESSSMLVAGIRVLPAQLARLLGVSKQAVSTWVKAGRVILGPDGRVDPNKAVARLLETGDPAKLRAKVLAPLLHEINRRDELIAELRSDLEAADEEAVFQKACHDDLRALLDALETRLVAEYPGLIDLGTEAAINAIDHWIATAREYGPARAGSIIVGAGNEGAPDET